MFIQFAFFQSSCFPVSFSVYVVHTYFVFCLLDRPFPNWNTIIIRINSQLSNLKITTVQVIFTLSYYHHRY